MSGRGFFAVDRGTWDCDLFADDQPFSRREAFFWLISEAAWKPRTFQVAGQTINLKPGQLAHSIRYIADQWHWPKSSVHRFLDHLENGTLIGTEIGTGITVITICGYNKFPTEPKDNGTLSGTLPGTVLGHEWDKTEEVNKVNTIKEAKASLIDARKRAPKAKRQLPPDWHPSTADLAFAASKGLSEQEAGEEAEAFRNHHFAHGKLMASWPHAWRTWVLNSKKFKGNRDAQANRRQKPNLDAIAEDMADEAREWERANGIGQPDDPFGGR